MNDNLADRLVGYALATISICVAAWTIVATIYFISLYAGAIQ
jgi:hypothetical protein